MTSLYVPLSISREGVGVIGVICVDDCSYVRHSPGHKPEREPLRGVCGSYLRQSWNIEMASSLQRVEKNSR
jgi:hypothetical protein